MPAFAGDAPHRYRTGDTSADITLVISFPVAG